MSLTGWSKFRVKVPCPFAPTRMTSRILILLWLIQSLKLTTFSKVHPEEDVVTCIPLTVVTPLTGIFATPAHVCAWKKVLNDNVQIAEKINFLIFFKIFNIVFFWFFVYKGQNITRFIIKNIAGFTSNIYLIIYVCRTTISH